MRDIPRMNIDATGLRIGMVTSAYHEEITTRMRDAAINTFLDAGGDEDDLYEVVAPGAFELVVLADALARKDLDGVIVLGCVIKGDTMHDQYICNSTSQMLAHISFEHEIPVGFGLLTLFSKEQGMDRAGGEKGNKGEETMNAVIATALGLQAIEEDLPDAARRHLEEDELEDDESGEEYEYEVVEEYEDGDEVPEEELEYEEEE
ncbi:MAG TPA: 6,7-dimethyl-8-ribityllumazine synthase, partial [Phycisphaerales bacterium]|nr:6,7-dimethyl-8-ribityllumazine synthase [Phycisphaerales bacterium]